MFYKAHSAFLCTARLDYVAPKELHVQTVIPEPGPPEGLLTVSNKEPHSRLTKKNILRPTLVNGVEVFRILLL